jgi:hypothetical protein
MSQNLQATCKQRTATFDFAVFLVASMTDKSIKGLQQWQL